MATSPQYTAIPRIGMVKIDSTNTSLDGSGILHQVFIAGTNGSRIDEVIVKATESTTTGIVRLFISDGTNSFLLTEISVTQCTISDSIKSFETGIKLGLIVPNGMVLMATSTTQTILNIIVCGGDF